MFESTVVLRKAVVPFRGRNFHLADDCPGIWQGWTNSANAGRQVWEFDRVSYPAAMDSGKFACRRCYAHYGLTIPAALDRKKVMAARRAAKAKAAA